MKKDSVYLSMGVVALLLTCVACTEELTDVQTDGLKQIVMTAPDFETEVGSRTNFLITNAGAEFSWSANDTVGIFPNEGAQAYFPMTSGAGTKTANFNGGGWALKDASTYAAYYPFIGDFYLEKNAISVDYSGQVQTGDASTTHLGAYDYMAAAPAAPQNGSVTFAFKHLGALVQLKLTIPQPTTVNSVTLTTDDEAFVLKGRVNIMAENAVIESVDTSNEVTLTVENVTTTEANQVVTLYMMLPPVDLSNKTLKAVVGTTSGNENMVLQSKNFQAGKSYALSNTVKVSGESCSDANHVHAIDLGLSVKWACHNVGASSPEGYGGYYAWGETEEKSSYTEYTYQYARDLDGDGSYWDNSANWINIGSNISGTQYDVAHVKWGGSWRMPTLSEIQELVNNCTWKWTTYNGVNGQLVTGPNGNSIFLPAAGYRYGTDLYYAGSYGYCWSATPYSDSRDAYDLYFYSGYYGWLDLNRYLGHAVRPVSE